MGEVVKSLYPFLTHRAGMGSCRAACGQAAQQRREIGGRRAGEICFQRRLTKGLFFFPNLLYNIQKTAGREARL